MPYSWGNSKYLKWAGQNRIKKKWTKESVSVTLPKDKERIMKWNKTVGCVTCTKTQWVTFNLEEL